MTMGATAFPTAEVHHWGQLFVAGEPQISQGQLLDAGEPWDPQMHKPSADADSTESANNATARMRSQPVKLKERVIPMGLPC